LKSQQLLSSLLLAFPLGMMLASCPAEPGLPLEFPESDWVYRSPATLAADPAGGHLWIAEETAARLSVLDLATETVEAVISLPGVPTGLAFSPDGSVLYATVGVAAGELVVIDPTARVVSRRLAIGHSPRSPVPHPDGQRLFVCHRFENEIGVIDLASGREITRVQVAREPVACALTADGVTLVVASHLPAGPADGDYAAAEVVLMDVDGRTAPRRIQLPNGSTALRDVCLSSDGRHAFVPHILARYHHPTTQLERGWINTNALSVVDVEAGALIATVLLDRPERGAALPWSVACTADGTRLVVTHAGSHAVNVLDLPGLLARVASLTPEERQSAADDLTFLGTLSTRIDLHGRGPRDVVVVGASAYAAEYFSDSIAVVALDDPSAQARTISLGALAPPTEVRWGEMLFQDATVCFQEWQSCESCHPDGRADGLNWDLLNDGFGNPKNTKSLLHAHATPPAMATGIRDGAEAAVRAGQRSILFASRPEEEALALDAFLASMRPVPSPRRARDGTLSAAAIRGRLIFAESGCTECHGGPHHTDLHQHDLENTRGQDAGRRLDTPSLVEAWRTAPYLHDGRARDLASMLIEHDPEGRHSSAATLSATELDDLVEYVLSL
jgi:DNA-binding beta-propeller fold protein YncE